MQKHDREQALCLLVEVVRTVGLGLLAGGGALLLVHGDGSGMSVLFGGLGLVWLSSVVASHIHRAASRTPTPESANNPEGLVSFASRAPAERQG